jgi:uncharacterized iron-regulated membrane protein
MADSRAAVLRRLWLNVHLWIGAGLGLLLIPIALSGCLLVWHDEIDGWLNPQRYAVSGPIALPPSDYLASAMRAVGPGIAPMVLRYPEHTGTPVIVQTRGRNSDSTPRLINVYLDPPTARVLDTVDAHSSFFGLLHRFHENLTIPDYSGRAVVGWLGVAMLMSSLTGIWLWWPRGAAVLIGLRWQRSPSTITNLHHMIGFWIALPLAAVSLTGVYLGFPQLGRQFLSSVVAMSPQGSRPFSGALAKQTNHTPDQTIAIALASVPNTRPVALFLPTVSQSDNVTWRIQLRPTGGDEPIIVLLDDKSDTIRPPSTSTLPGDRIAQWIRWIHEGSHSGPVWRVIVFLCGLAPPVFVVTGVTMWLRQRSDRKKLTGRGVPGYLRAAE